MTNRQRLLGALAVSFLVSGCASRKLPLPTLEDYSDRVSTWTERFLEDWKNGASDATLYSAGFRWRGPLPGDLLEEAPSRPPLSIRTYRGGAPATSSGSAVELRRRFREIRARFE